MDIIRGPSRGEIDAALSHEHIAKLDTCKSLDAEKLDGFRDHLVGVVYRASSLQVEDPIRHLRPLIDGTDMDPRLAAKRLPVDRLAAYAAESNGPIMFQYIGESLIELGRLRSPSILRQKLTAGGLEEEVDYMSERERSAERHLLEDIARRPERYPELAKQIEQVVLGECREAHLRAREKPSPYGSAMMIDVQDRLRKTAKEEAALVGNHTYECLIGMAGRARLREAREAAEKDATNLNSLKDLFLDCLVRSEVPGISRSDVVDISPQTFLPELHSPGVADTTVASFATLSSGGKKTLFKCCFAVAIHRLAVQVGAPLPEMLIIDSPMKNISERKS
jgi:hypothetical protein